MNWNYRKWTYKQRLLGLLIVAILAFFFFISRGHAEETAGDHLKEAVFDTLAASASFVAAAEQAATGNFVTGAVLTSLGVREGISAYYEYKAAYEIYYSPNENGCESENRGGEINIARDRD